MERVKRSEALYEHYGVLLLVIDIESVIALIGYSGTIFGLANVCTNGNTINVDLATNYLPQSGKVFEAWLVDDAPEGSGYALSMGKILASGTLEFQEIMTNAKT
jgi:hypothetical protein